MTTVSKASTGQEQYLDDVHAEIASLHGCPFDIMLILEQNSEFCCAQPIAAPNKAMVLWHSVDEPYLIKYARSSALTFSDHPSYILRVPKYECNLCDQYSKNLRF